VYLYFVRGVLFVAALAQHLASGRTGEVARPLEAMLAVPAGTFLMGATDEARGAALELCKEEIGRRQERACQPELFAIESPQRKVYLAAFSVDRVEVTVGAYRACVRAGACAPEPLLVPDARFLQSTLPITSVTFAEAERFCAWRGARLPSEAEWERAARGTDGRTWPWGNTPRPGASNHGRFETTDELAPNQTTLIRPDASDGWAFLAPVGSYPDGASPVGALDMAGNAMEWTADVYHEEPPQRGSTVNPRGPRLGALRVTRGGSWRQPRMFQRTTARDGAAPETRSPELGFRCVR
jgi:formylglycine-generating enzyme required for sulfatase activity